MKYVVYGLGISGISTAKFLVKNGEEVIATDDNENTLAEDIKKYPELKFAKSDEILFDSKTIIILAPGIPLYFPKPHKILEICKKTGATLACDIEIFYRQNNAAKFIAITGTNGKSTTTALSGFIFEQLKIPSSVGGNIGVPCFDLLTSFEKGDGEHSSSEDFTKTNSISKENHPSSTTAMPPSFSKRVYIFETSSFQLDLLSQTHFKIAALLNITPDHIDRHGSMDSYIEAKKRVFRNQAAGDFALIDVDNENSKKVFAELKADKNFKATLVPISTKKIQENGVSLFGDKLVNKIGKANLELELKSEFLRGEHNDQNMAFAFAIAFCHMIQQGEHGFEEKIISAIKKFQGLRHRMQIVGKIGNTRFINDSKATNAESTEHALKAYEDIFWIVGGKAKDGGIENLQPYFGKISKAYLIGDSSEDFAKTLEKNSVIFEKCGDLKTAFEKALLDIKKSSLTEKNILLSPACASFDQWKNFEQRGDYFCKLFDELPKS